MPTYSIAEAANLICTAHNWSPDTKARVHRQIKHWRNEGLIIPFARQTDARGTDRFDDLAICRARFLMVLADIGMDTIDMRTVLWHSDQYSSLENAIAAIAGMAAKFTCFIRINRDGTGRKIVTASIAPDNDLTFALTDAERDAAESSDIYGQVEALVPLDRILGPVLGLLRSV